MKIARQKKSALMRRRTRAALAPEVAIKKIADAIRRSGNAIELKSFSGGVVIRYGDPAIMADRRAKLWNAKIHRRQQEKKREENYFAVLKTMYDEGLFH